jgi:hypothetical protein
MPRGAAQLELAARALELDFVTGLRRRAPPRAWAFAVQEHVEVEFAAVRPGVPDGVSALDAAARFLAQQQLDVLRRADLDVAHRVGLDRDPAHPRGECLVRHHDGSMSRRPADEGTTH